MGTADGQDLPCGRSAFIGLLGSESVMLKLVLTENLNFMQKTWLYVSQADYGLIKSQYVGIILDFNKIPVTLPLPTCPRVLRDHGYRKQTKQSKNRCYSFSGLLYYNSAF